jgi:hypothetical protein
MSLEHDDTEPVASQLLAVIIHRNEKYYKADCSITPYQFKHVKNPAKSWATEVLSKVRGYKGLQFTMILAEGGVLKAYSFHQAAEYQPIPSQIKEAPLPDGKFLKAMTSIVEVLELTRSKLALYHEMVGTLYAESLKEAETQAVGVEHVGN